MNTSEPAEPRTSWRLTAGMLVAAIAAIKLLLHLYAGRRGNKDQ